MWDWPDGLQRRHCQLNFFSMKIKKERSVLVKQTPSLWVISKRRQKEGSLAVWTISNLGSGQNVIALGKGQANGKNDVVVLRFFIASHLFFS